MKKTGLVLIVILLALILVACGGPSKKECDDAWLQIDWGEVALWAAEGETTLEGAFENFNGVAIEAVNYLLNNEHSPDSVGYTLKECINNGYDWRVMLEIVEEGINN